MSERSPIIANYQITEPLYDGSRTQVFRGIAPITPQPIFLKVLRNRYPNCSELVEFRNQYTISCNLDPPEIVRPLALERHGDGFILVVPDEGVMSLPRY